eukprot:scaffold73298_cov30-Prasinocladus_malaysianus.AAC.1
MATSRRDAAFTPMMMATAAISLCLICAAEAQTPASPPPPPPPLPLNGVLGCSLATNATDDDNDNATAASLITYQPNPASRPAITFTATLPQLPASQALDAAFVANSLEPDFKTSWKVFHAAQRNCD